MGEMRLYRGDKAAVQFVQPIGLVVARHHDRKRGRLRRALQPGCGIPSGHLIYHQSASCLGTDSTQSLVNNA
jgi:hypothetical protein